MSKDFSYLRTWLQNGHRPVILECIRSRSGMSMGVYDRGERIFIVNGCGFDRIGAALGEFLERLFQKELQHFVLEEEAAGLTAYLSNSTDWQYCERHKALHFHCEPFKVSPEGACGIESMIRVADAIGLKVHQSESKAGTLIIIQKAR